MKSYTSFITLLTLLLLMAGSSLVYSDNRSKVASLADKIIIQYYYLSTCPYCQKIEPELMMLAKNTGIRIQPMSLDGNPMALTDNGKPFEFIDGSSFALAFDIRETPTLVIHEPPNNYAVMSTGYKSYESLLAYIIYYASQRGLSY